MTRLIGARITQRVLAVVLAIAMAVSSTAGAQASTRGPHLLQQQVTRSDVQSVRFISPDDWDPTKPGVGTNRYAYAQNDPVNKSDPNGHIWGFVAAAAFALFAGTKEANTPEHDRDISNKSDAAAMADMAAAAAGVGILGKIAKGLTPSMKKTDEQNKQTVESASKIDESSKVEVAPEKTVTVAELKESLPKGMTLAKFGELAGFTKGQVPSSLASTQPSAEAIANLKAAGVTPETVAKVQQFYAGVAKAFPNNLAAVQRTQLLSNMMRMME